MGSHKKPRQRWDFVPTRGWGGLTESQVYIFIGQNIQKGVKIWSNVGIFPINSEGWDKIPNLAV